MASINSKNVLQEFRVHTELMTKEGIYPYSFMDSFEKFDVDLLSLTKCDFRNNLTGEDISDCDYEFYKKISAKFNVDIELTLWRVISCLIIIIIIIIMSNH